MVMLKSYIGLNGQLTTKNPFPNHNKSFINNRYINPYAQDTREGVAFEANFKTGTGIGGGYARSQAGTRLRNWNDTPTPEEEAKTNTGANRGAVSSLGTSSGIGTAGSAQAGLVGSVNTEVQNDDQLLPYTKI